MKSKIVTVAIMSFVVMLATLPIAAKTARTSWENYGYCSSDDVWDANAIKDSNALYSSLLTNFTALSDVNNHIFWIPVPPGYDNIALRFRGSAKNTAATAEILLLTSGNDAEYWYDIECTADASAMPATAILDCNDKPNSAIPGISGTGTGTKTSGGYYFGNITDSNTPSCPLCVVKINCDSKHRICVYSWDLRQNDIVIVHPKSVTNGVFYWDASFFSNDVK